MQSITPVLLVLFISIYINSLKRPKAQHYSLLLIFMYVLDTFSIFGSQRVSCHWSSKWVSFHDFELVISKVFVSPSKDRDYLI